MPLHEIRQRFTKSDMAVMAWRATEMAANMRDRTLPSARLPEKLDGGSYNFMENVDHDEMLKRIEERLGPIVWKMTDERGEIDLRKLTGDEALTYMQTLGIPVVKMGR